MFGGQGDALGQLRHPADVAVAGEFLVVSEWTGQRLQLFTHMGAAVRIIDTGGTKEAYGVAWDSKRKRILAVDRDIIGWSEYSTDGRTLARFSSARLDCRLLRPCGIGVNGSGDILLSDAEENSIHKFSPDGEWKGPLVTGHTDAYAAATESQVGSVVMRSPPAIPGLDNAPIGTVHTNVARAKELRVYPEERFTAAGRLFAFPCLFDVQESRVMVACILSNSVERVLDADVNYQRRRLLIGFYGAELIRDRFEAEGIFLPPSRCMEEVRLDKLIQARLEVAAAGTQAASQTAGREPADIGSLAAQAQSARPVDVAAAAAARSQLETRHPPSWLHDSVNPTPFGARGSPPNTSSHAPARIGAGTSDVQAAIPFADTPLAAGSAVPTLEPRRQATSGSTGSAKIPTSVETSTMPTLPHTGSDLTGAEAAAGASSQESGAGMSPLSEELTPRTMSRLLQHLQQQGLRLGQGGVLTSLPPIGAAEQPQYAPPYGPGSGGTASELPNGAGATSPGFFPTVAGNNSGTSMDYVGRPRATSGSCVDATSVPDFVDDGDDALAGAVGYGSAQPGSDRLPPGLSTSVARAPLGHQDAEGLESTSGKFPSDASISGHSNRSMHLPGAVPGQMRNGRLQAQGSSGAAPEWQT